MTSSAFGRDTVASGVRRPFGVAGATVAWRGDGRVGLVFVLRLDVDADGVVVRREDVENRQQVAPRVAVRFVQRFEPTPQGIVVTPNIDSNDHHSSVARRAMTFNNFVWSSISITARRSTECHRRR
jgi:hypothetical protein